MTEIFPIKLGPTNIYLIKTKQGYIQIDAGYKSSIKKYLRFLEKHNIKTNDIKLIIVTHAHTDHVGALSRIKEITKAKILVHENDKDALIKGRQVDVKAITLSGKFLMWIMPKSMHYFEPVKPDIVVNDDFSLSNFGLNAKVVHTPGHTQGNISIIDNEGNAFVGCLAQGPPLRFKAGFPATAVDINGVIKSMNKLLKKGTKIFYVGHGKPIKAEIIQKILEKKNTK